MTTTGTERGTELGQGLYSLADLRTFLALSGTRRDADKAPEWLREALNPVGHRRWRPDYSFADLISLFVVRELRSKGVRTADIKEAERYLRKKWDTARPFASNEIKTDGRGVFVDDELVAGQVEAAERGGQQVIRQTVSERLTRVGYDDAGWAAYWAPTEAVLIDPRVQFGEPVIAGTRIPTQAILDMTHFATLDDIAADLRIRPGQAKAAVAFEKQRQSALTN